MNGRAPGLWYVLWRSLRYRRARSLSALVALTVSAAVATALLTLYADLDAKLHHEFRGFGANIVVKSERLTAEQIARAQQAAGEDASVAAFAYAVATTDRSIPIVVAGVDFAAVRRLDSWWSVSAWPASADGALIGQRAAQSIGDAKALTLSFAGKAQTFTGEGELKTGGDEDSRVYLPLAAFTEWTKLQPGVLEVQVPGGATKVEAAISRLKQALPDADVEPVRQLVEGESRIVDRTRALMYGAMLLIALTVAVSVLATLSASVLERRRDFALMKALGGTVRQMMALFVAETMLLALGGLVLGWVVGSVTAWAISELDFGTASLPRVSVVPLVLALNVVIAALAALLPLRALQELEPASMLKGE